MNNTNFLLIIILLLLSISKGTSQPEPIADQYFQKADVYKKDLLYDSAVIYYNVAADEFLKFGIIEKYIDSYNQIGIILTRQDKYKEARTFLNKALSAGIKSLDTNNLTVATTYISLGVLDNAEGNYIQSLKNHYRALSIRLAILGENHPDVTTSYGNIGNVYRNKGDIDESIEAHLRAMQIRENIFGVTSPEIVESYVGLGKACVEQKEYEEALNYFERALNNKILQRGTSHKDLVRYFKYVSEVYYLMGNKLKGDEYNARSEQSNKL